MTTDTDKLTVAITTAKAGDRVLARQLLSEYVKENPSSEMGWLWLYVCVNVADQKRYCLIQALKINPNNPDTKKALAQLDQPKLAENIATPAKNISTQKTVSAPIHSESCPKCGTTRQIEHKFCISCGYSFSLQNAAQLTPTQPTAKQNLHNKKKCIYCGEEFSDGSVVCQRCHQSNQQILQYLTEAIQYKENEKNSEVALLIDKIIRSGKMAAIPLAHYRQAQPIDSIAWNLTDQILCTLLDAPTSQMLAKAEDRSAKFSAALWIGAFVGGIAGASLGGVEWLVFALLFAAGGAFISWSLASAILGSNSFSVAGQIIDGVQNSRSLKQLRIVRAAYEEAIQDILKQYPKLDNTAQTSANNPPEAVPSQFSPQAQSYPSDQPTQNLSFGVSSNIDEQLLDILTFPYEVYYGRDVMDYGGKPVMRKGAYTIFTRHERVILFAETVIKEDWHIYNNLEKTKELYRIELIEEKKISWIHSDYIFRIIKSPDHELGQLCLHSNAKNFEYYIAGGKVSTFYRGNLDKKFSGLFSGKFGYLVAKMWQYDPFFVLTQTKDLEPMMLGAIVISPQSPRSLCVERFNGAYPQSCQELELYIIGNIFVISEYATLQGMML